MSDLLGPKGKQIPNHSLEVEDLPIIAPDAVLVSNGEGAIVGVPSDTFIQSKMSTGAEPNRVWSAEKATAEITQLSAFIAEGGNTAEGRTLAATNFFGGAPAANACIFMFAVTESVVIPLGAPGSAAKAYSAAAALTTFTIYKNTTSIGTISFAAGASVGSFSFIAPIYFDVGDTLSIVAPPSPDTGLRDVAVNIGLLCQHPSNYHVARPDALTPPLNTTMVYEYAGAPQTILVPAGCTKAEIHLWGAGAYSYNGTCLGGGGGYAGGGPDANTISATPGQQWGVSVGGAGIGGGSGSLAGMGAGFSEVFNITENTLIALAAGGGGATQYGSGGAGGGLTGQSMGGSGGSGGTQVAGGAAGSPATGIIAAGSFRQGGYGYTCNTLNNGGFNGGGAGKAIAGGGGGGGGYFGGGGGWGAYGGGGGSSYINPAITGLVTLGGDKATPGYATHPTRVATQAGSPGRNGMIIITFKP